MAPDISWRGIKANLYVWKVLNLHGEVLESLAPADTTLEEAFLPTLKTLHERFPQLRIVVRIFLTSF
jgi:dihydroorotase